MANQIEGVKERLLQCATKEFMEKGYADASLRRIAAEAKTSTSSIYVRFGDKSGLFSAILSDACEGFLKLYQDGVDRFNQLNPSMPVQEMIDYKKEYLVQMIDYLYTHFDAFKLLTSKAESRTFSDFLHQLADMECFQTERYITALHSDLLTSGALSSQLIRTLSSAYWSGVFEIVVQNMTRAEAQTYFLALRRFFTCGWLDLLMPEKE